MRIKKSKYGEAKSLPLQKSIKYSFHILFNLSSTVIMLDKMNQQTYKCRQCHKMTTGYPALYRNKCLECRNLEMRNIIEKERMGRLMKKELVQENKKLTDKMRNLQDIDLFDNDVSSDENFQEDPNFVPPLPHLKKSKSLTNTPGEKNISEISDIEDEPTANIAQSSHDSESDCHEESITKNKKSI